MARLAGGGGGAGGSARMKPPALAADPAERLNTLLRERIDAGEHFFVTHAEGIARLCHLMAERFARGGRLIAVGRSPAARSDARHVAVEFVHPVIVGKRALPAFGLSAEGGALAAQLQSLAHRDDMVIGFEVGEDGGDAAAALELARARGCLTIGFAAGGAEYVFEPPSNDPQIRQELVETLYHVLWELVHVFFEHRGLLAGRSPRRTHDAGASSFLYPFLDERESQLEPVMDDVRRSVLIKARETAELRGQTLTDNAGVLAAAAAEVRTRLQRGGKLLALGNGGSATDAMDAVADFRSGAGGSAIGWPAIDLTEDPAILTAIANDIGTEAIFLRQVIAYGAADDVLLSFSTSGNSVNVIAALEQARRQGLISVAFVGYDGGRIAAEALAEHVIITRSEHIPRIQEAQASAYHALRDLVG
ncbi:MAG: SIS domain-containing protein [Solirubrobacteraceae bacterium]